MCACYLLNIFWGQTFGTNIDLKKIRLYFMHKVDRSWSQDKMCMDCKVLKRLKTTTVKHCCSHSLKHLVKRKMLHSCITCYDQNESRELLLLTCGEYLDYNAAGWLEFPSPYTEKPDRNNKTKAYVVIKNPGPEVEWGVGLHYPWNPSKDQETLRMGEKRGL